MNKKEIVSTDQTEKNNFIIPEEFQLFGHVYRVEMVDDFYEKEDCYGEADPDNKIIRLQKIGSVKIKTRDKRTNKKKECIVNITHDDVLETFFHELTHIILASMEERQLYANEKFVSLFSRSLHQIFKSSK